MKAVTLALLLSTWEAVTVRGDVDRTGGLGPPQFSLGTFNKLLARQAAALNIKDPHLRRRQLEQNAITASTAPTAFAYHAYIQVGTPPADFAVIFDTGSFQLWLRSTACTSTACANKAAYNPVRSSTYKSLNKAGNAAYVDNTFVQGTLATETVAVHNLSVAGLEFLEVNSTNNNMAEVGIIGMCVPPEGYPVSFMQNLVMNRKISSPVMGYYIDATGIKGSLDFGGVDKARFTGNLTWMPIYGTGESDDGVPYIFFQTLQTGLSFNNQNGTFANMTMSQPFLAVMDTGTSLSLYPRYIAKQIAVYIGFQALTATTSANSTANGTLYGKVCQSGIPSTLPNITLSFNGGAQSFVLAPQDYVFLSTSPTSGVQFCLCAFFGSDVDQGSGTRQAAPGAIIGNALLRKYYTVFDWGTPPKFGFAVANRAVGIKANLVPSNESVFGTATNPIASARGRTRGRVGLLTAAMTLATMFFAIQ
ncbi:hypothetical protein HK104_001674 [Borealophlyctis nickersoniae]|nr:hypothetical protein HK104_001674 [Borealophlyctis nickersoniae]